MHKSDAQKHMVEFGFEHKFHDLEYVEVGFPPPPYSFNALYTWGHHQILFNKTIILNKI